MSILVPCNPKKGNKTADDEPGSDKVFFVAGTVFDVSQTDEIEAKTEDQAPAVTVTAPAAAVVQSELF